MPFATQISRLVQRTGAVLHGSVELLRRLGVDYVAQGLSARITIKHFDTCTTPNLHMLIGGSIGHRQVVRVIVEWVHVQAILGGSPSQLPQHIGDVLLLLDR